MQALSLRDVARELGRTEDWVQRNWQQLVADKKMPPPLHPTGSLQWSAPGFFAWLDRDLPAPLRPHAAAYRAAYDAATAPPQDDVADARERLNKRFADRSQTVRA